MKLSHHELDHIIFLSNVVLEGRKRGLMEDTIQCLLYIVKSLREAELPESTGDEIKAIIGRLEAQLKQENERTRELKRNLSAPRKRNRRNST